MLYSERLAAEKPALIACLKELYGTCDDFPLVLEKLEGILERYGTSAIGPKVEATWMNDNREIGMMLYVDLFAGSLAALEERIPYLADLGITYVHLMPLFCSPDGENDGGYAVSSYRSVDPRLGTIQDLSRISSLLHKNGMRLVLDFVFNHTSDEHDWAIAAKKGNPFYRNFYYLYPDKADADRWNMTLREIFPSVRRGSFTYVSEVNAWVWTTFNSFQWDLNYANPYVFLAMCDEMLSLASLGIDVLRLDALAFVWKQQGTSCENLPEAHTLIRAFRHAAAIAAPSLVFKSEAIVHPDNVIKYIGREECELSYNPLQMALFWEAAATRDTTLLTTALSKRWTIPPGCAWVNYLRCHDDIGWTFSDEDAASVGINGYDHRHFLNIFYTGRFSGSFARGEAFQLNLQTGDCRVCGTLASLAGLEEAYDLYANAYRYDDTILYRKAELYAESAYRRITLLFSLLCALPGIPLLYAGDETGMLNDYRYAQDAAKKADSRWVHRIVSDWNRIRQICSGESGADGIHSDTLQRQKPVAPDSWLLGWQRQIYLTVKRFISLRKAEPFFASPEILFVPTGNTHLCTFFRTPDVFIAGNFSDDIQLFTVPDNSSLENSAWNCFTDILSGCDYEGGREYALKPWGTLWLKRTPDVKRN